MDRQDWELRSDAMRWPPEPEGRLYHESQHPCDLCGYVEGHNPELHARVAERGYAR